MLVEAYSEITDAYARISHALGELKKYMSPVSLFLVTMTVGVGVAGVLRPLGLPRGIFSSLK